MTVNDQVSVLHTSVFNASNVVEMFSIRQAGGTHTECMWFLSTSGHGSCPEDILQGMALGVWSLAAPISIVGIQDKHNLDYCPNTKLDPHRDISFRNSQFK